MILCVGLSPALGRVLQLDSLVIGGVNRAGGYIDVAAGKATNAARVVVELGGRATLLSPLGSEDAPRYTQLLRDDGVEVSSVEYPGRIRWALTLLDPDKYATEIVLREPKPVPASVTTEILERFGSLTGKAAACLIAGSRLLDLPQELLVEMAQGAVEAEVPLFLDITGDDLRSVLEALHRDSRKRDPQRRRRRLVLKVNEAEFLETFDGRNPEGADGRDSDETRLLGQLSSFSEEHGCILVVTRGPSPVLWAAPTGEGGTVATEQVAAVNPIGSGDTFLATLAVRLTEGRTIPEALEAAAAMASRNATFLRPATVLGP